MLWTQSTRLMEMWVASSREVQGGWGRQRTRSQMTFMCAFIGLKQAPALVPGYFV